jgi:exodeoxyribonuclease VII large subunit
MTKHPSISLYELQENIGQALGENLKHSYWITAEINELKISQSGHCYLMLIEKDKESNMIKAKAPASIWEYSFRLLQAYFENATGRPLAIGLEIMAKASVHYHPLYGLSLTITDINPAYTVGGMVIQRRNTIAQIQADGVFDMNKALTLAVLPQRVAVISSEQAAGYQDFVHHLHENDYGYDFSITLFPSLVQGEKAAQEIMNALDLINECKEAFDVVVIIRGGGAVADLACFDDYNLASYVAQFPLPVLTGIGHDKDESIADMVAYRSLKTPTATAGFLIDRLADEDLQLSEYTENMGKLVTAVLDNEVQQLNALHQNLRLFSRERLQQEHFNLQLTTNMVESHNPLNILSRGYAIARLNGKILTDAKSVKENDEIEIILHKGNLRTVVRDKQES